MTVYWVIVNGKPSQKFLTSEEAEAYAQFLRDIGRSDVRILKKTK